MGNGDEAYEPGSPKRSDFLGNADDLRDRLKYERPPTKVGDVSRGDPNRRWTADEMQKGFMVHEPTSSLVVQHDHEDGLHVGGSVAGCPDCDGMDSMTDRSVHQRTGQIFRDRRG